MAVFEKAHSNLIELDKGWESYFGADFSRAQELVKRAEGKYGNNPNDNGNWTSGKKGSGTLIGTNWGISAPTLGTWLGREATEQEMRDLTYDESKKIYKKFFWDKIGGDGIKSQSVANSIYDAYVNQTGWTKTMLNDTLKNVGKEATATMPLKSDTIKDINDVNASKFFDEFKKQREVRYKQTAEREGQAGFLKGWMNRLGSLTFEDVEKFAKRNWLALTLSFMAIAGLTYYAYKNRNQIAKAVFN